LKERGEEKRGREVGVEKKGEGGKERRRKGSGEVDGRGGKKGG